MSLIDTLVNKKRYKCHVCGKYFYDDENKKLILCSGKCFGKWLENIYGGD